MNIKDNRQAAITSIINSRRIHTQEELADALGEKGHSVTQATLSRDTKELGAIKVPDAYGFYYKMPSRAVSYNSMNIEKIDISGQLCVLHSKPGFASAIASVVDSAQIE